MNHFHTIKGLNCYEAAIYTCAQLSELEGYEIMLFDTMGFSLNWADGAFDLYQNPIYGDPRDYGAIENNFRDYLGFCLEKEEFDFHNYIENADEALISIAIDCYHAKWITRYYKKKHAYHIITLQKSKETGEILCYDMNFEHVAQPYDVSLFGKDKIKDIFVCHFCEPKKKWDYESLWEKSRNHLRQTDYITPLKEFRVLIDKNVNLKEFYGEEDALGIKLIGEMIPVIGGRKAYRIYLNKMSEITKNEKIAKSAERIDQVITNWEKVFLILIKCCFTEADEKKKDILSLLDMIYEMEEDLRNQILRIEEL